jgi:hypothetical protein
MYNHIMKKVHFDNSQLTVVLIAVVFVLVGGLILGQSLGRSSTRLTDLPKPELSEGQRGELGIDKNINETTIDLYLGRADSVYYDMRMLEDPANYEAIEDGDRYLSGIVEGFEVLPFPYLVNVNGMLPEAVGKSYDGKTLFAQNDEGEYEAKFKESQQILEDLFPKNKYIFLMCGGGGYAGMTKDLLVSQGWDEDKIYVVGGYWYYTGDHNVEIKRTDDEGKTTYAFWKLKYHDIDFSKLTEK